MACSPCAVLLIAALIAIAAVIVVATIQTVSSGRSGFGRKSGYLVYGPYNDLDGIGSRGQYYALEEDPGAGGPAGGW